MNKIKIFKSHITETKDTNFIESSLNSFIKGKDIISINQSVTPSVGTQGELYFIVITVVYREG